MSWGQLPAESFKVMKMKPFSPPMGEQGVKKETAGQTWRVFTEYRTRESWAGAGSGPGCVALRPLTRIFLHCLLRTWPSSPALSRLSASVLTLLCSSLSLAALHPLWRSPSPKPDTPTLLQAAWGSLSAGFLNPSVLQSPSSIRRVFTQTGTETCCR